jgi:hypothetical protein
MALLMPIELPVGDPVGWAIGILGVLVGFVGIVAAVRMDRRAKRDHEKAYQQALHDAEEAPLREFEKYLGSDVPQGAAALIEGSLYVHLPKAIRKTFADAWVRRIATDISARTPEDNQRLVRFTRLFIEYVFYETALTKVDEGATWPGQTPKEHVLSLNTTYLTAQTCFSNFSPREYDTPFPLQEMLDGSPRVANYFDALKSLSLPDALMLPRERFISQVRIKTGFVAPLHLITGLLRQMDSDWPHLLAQFRKSISTFPLTDEVANSKPELVLEHVQAFEFYCWLLWGPSIQMCKCPGWSGLPQILQYGYGDENNSFHLVFDNERIKEQSWAEIDKALVRARRRIHSPSRRRSRQRQCGARTAILRSRGYTVRQRKNLTPTTWD